MLDYASLSPEHGCAYAGNMGLLDIRLCGMGFLHAFLPLCNHDGARYADVPECTLHHYCLHPTGSAVT
jgi:hypothetical protein